ncbi:S-layer homology domain-containing protein [Paenibacillus radicis (ex Xue et al. 2023)]|uniref:S-layer homology domain-containing protein n=1 Tax=Paenibacillus radicis (ex Xue et al. 2023) TaxID=2972489 RepID=A0ABT1YC92_9BACL|nr:S-layer homology domain-containing protein [Paenibacillus radicis (ex Xue et al. 2023)]MCR8630380.1 S-layer homology domain-containing protein [Paenibacillus radicis (ex Xue et al. 2023)]
MQGKKALIIVMILTMILSMIPLSSVGAASPADSITISDPRSMAYYNGYIYVAQRNVDKISRISTTTGQVSDVLVMSTYSTPMSVAINSHGDLFYTKDSNKNVFKIPAASLTSLPLSASQVNTLSQSYYLGNFNYMNGITFDSNDNLFMTDYTSNGIYRLDLGQTVPTAVITGASKPINGIAFNTNGDLYFVDEWSKAYKINNADLAVKSATDPTKLQLLESISNPAAYGVIFLPDGTHYVSSLSGVIVKHTFASESAIPVAKNLLPSSLTVTEGTITNLLTYLNGLSGMSATGVTLSLTSSNANVANNGAITYTSSAVTGNVSVIITKAGETQDTKTIAVTVPAHTPTPAELANASIAAAKALLPSSLTVIEGTYTNLLTYLNGLSGMSATGVTLSLTSSNANVANNGAITYTSSAVTGNVTVLINKANGTQATKNIAVTVPAHTPTPAELANASIASAKALLPTSLTVTEGTYTNLLTYLNGLSGMSATGVTLSLTSSNANVANNGAITYTSSAVSGNVTVLINKTNGTQDTKTIAVTVSAHTPTPAELANASIASAKALLPSSLTVTEGTYTNLLTYLNGLSGMSATGVTLSLTSSNANVANDGTITYTSAAVTGNVTVLINKANGTQATKTIAVTVPAHTLTPAELANASIASAKALLPSSLTVTEGTYTNLLTYLNGLSGMSATGVTLSLTSSNANVANNGAITFTGSAVSGNVTILINKANGTQDTKTIAVTVSAHTLTPAELANASIAAAKALLPSSLTVTEGTSTNLLTYLNGLSGMSDTGVTLTLVSSNANVANNGAITHTSAAVTGNVTVIINKANGTQDTRTIAVNVSPLPVQVTVTSLSVDAANANITINGVKQLVVSAAYSNNTTADVTATASYSTSNGSVAIVSAAGIITAVGFGAADITVSYSGQSKVVAVTVPRPASHSSSSTGASAPAVPATDTKQPEDKVTPTVPSTQPAITDVFKSDAVKTDSSVVNRISTRIENANKSEVKMPFSDIQQHWANKTIESFIKLNIIEGYNDGKFRPDGAITRAEFAVIIDRVFGINNDLKQSVAMNDISNHWAKGTIEKLANAGILNGYGQEFRPDQTVSRAEMVAIISRIVNMSAVQKNESKGAFSDTGNSFAFSQIQEAAQAGIVAGKEGNNFNPDAQSTRAEALTIILNTLNLSPQIKTLLDSLK